MSITKRVWLELDPAYADVRKAYAEKTSELKAMHKFPAPMRRKNRLASDPYYDPLWPGRLRAAAKSLGLSHIVVNWQMMFQCAEERDAALALANTLWDAELERRKALRRTSAG